MLTKTFSGGVHPDISKELTVDKRITPCPIPKKLSIPLLQHTGLPAEAKVGVGEAVLKGQLLGEPESFISARVHAPTSGKITAIKNEVIPIYGRTACIFLESDGKDAPHPFLSQGSLIENLSREEIIDRIRDAGIVGLGGAAFPTHVKMLTAKKDKHYSLIINGAECEPYLTCDHRLMIEKTQDILKGIELVAKAVSAEAVYIAIEDNKLSAIFAMEKMLARLKAQDSRLKAQVIRLKTKYPQGGEKQLISAILNRQVPPGKLPLDVDCIVQNVGTVFAIYEAIYQGKPLIERCVTLTGSPLKEPGNFTVRIGSLLGDVVEQCCGGFIKEPAKVILGGPMMGIAYYTLDIPIIKGITGVVFLSKEEVEIEEEMPCIKCAKCVDICPVNLIPTHIARGMKKEDSSCLEMLNVFDCIECGACSFGCPARIPLVQYIKLAKAFLKKK